MTVRLSKIVMCLCLAVFAFLVAFGNITDYGSNFAFVQHVLSMDTTFPGNQLMGRAITNPTLWHAAYIGIIIAEGMTFLLLGIGALVMLTAIGGPAERFNRTKVWLVAGVTLGFCVWFFGFMVVLP